MRLELSSEGRYALRALLYLARIGKRATADKISAESRVPRRLLARILAKEDQTLDEFAEKTALTRRSFES